MRALQVSAREQAAREVASARAAYLKAHVDYLAALEDLADYQAAEDLRQEMVDDYKLAQQADYEPDTGHA
jgi:ABC-type transport system involved in cytochrome bd biosynthesis fused ATPase/permease subunit